MTGGLTQDAVPNDGKGFEKSSAPATGLIRLDLQVAHQLGTSREEAQRVIAGGHVRLNGRVLLKQGMKLSPEATLAINGGRRPYVSRGGEKLEKALAFFQIRLDGLICLDVGASTGGFTDCMLQHGATRVYAVENGSSQLSAGLQNDPRVCSYEQTDIREMTLAQMPAAAFAAVDVSFISLTKVLASIKRLIVPGAGLVCLIKPQFEAGPGQTGKRGLIRDEKIRKRTIAQVTAYGLSIGLLPQGVTESPVDTGNKEYLTYFINGKD